MMTEQGLRKLICKKVAEIGSVNAAAKAWKIWPSYLSESMTGVRPIRNAMAAKVGYRKLAPSEPRFVRISK